MSSTSPSPFAPAPFDAPAAARRRSAFVAILSSEFRLLLREPLPLFWGLLFPVVILVAIGAVPSDRRPSVHYAGASVVSVYVPILVAFGLGMVALNALPPTLAAYREQGILRRLASTPVGPARIVGAQLGVHLGLVLSSAAVTMLVGRVAFGVGLPETWLLYVVIFGLTAVALLSIGTLIASVAPTTRVANASGAIMFFPMMFFAGLWVPREQMGTVLREISNFTPLGAGVGALQDAARGASFHPVYMVVVAAYAVICGGAAVQSFRWE
jgi:ABC-2 type transport system permease protein